MDKTNEIPSKCQVSPPYSLKPDCNPVCPFVHVLAYYALDKYFICLFISFSNLE